MKYKITEIMKIIQKTKELYKKYLFKFFEKNEKFNSFSTLEQSKYIANKIVLVNYSI